MCVGVGVTDVHTNSFKDICALKMNFESFQSPKTKSNIKLKNFLNDNIFIC